MKYEICKNVMVDDQKRKAFDTLIHNQFWLSFSKWYEEGKWGPWNQPYTLFDGDKAVSNVTVNHMKALYEGKEREYIQIGGVTTNPDYRGQGLSRLLMEEVLADWADACDTIFLLGNATVTEFYPRFGFVEKPMYNHFWNKTEGYSQVAATGTVRKLNLEKEADQAILARCYEKKNPFAKLQFVDNFSLLQFYCTCGMEENLYYIEAEDAVIVQETEDGVMNCLDVFYDGERSLLQLMSYLVDDTVTRIQFGFTPCDTRELVEERFVDEDTHLFVLKGKEDIFANDRLFIPELSHT